MFDLITAFMLAGAAPPAAAVPPARPAVGATDPARLQLARAAVDHIWPVGTYARMMKGTFEQMMDSMMATMLDMPMQDMVSGFIPQGEDGEQARKELGNASMRELAAKADPHFEERFRITNRVMMSEITTLMTQLEPALREGLSRAYAGRFSAEQLTDLNRFFATPTGRVYAAESMLLFTDPEVMKLMAKATPELMKAMPAMYKKVEAATAHLPPPPKPKHEDGDHANPAPARS